MKKHKNIKNLFIIMLIILTSFHLFGCSTNTKNILDKYSIETEIKGKELTIEETKIKLVDILKGYTQEKYTEIYGYKTDSVNFQKIELKFNIDFKTIEEIQYYIKLTSQGNTFEYEYFVKDTNAYIKLAYADVCDKTKINLQENLEKESLEELKDFLYFYKANFFIYESFGKLEDFEKEDIEKLYYYINDNENINIKTIKDNKSNIVITIWNEETINRIVFDKNGRVIYYEEREGINLKAYSLGYGKQKIKFPSTDGYVNFK